MPHIAGRTRTRIIITIFIVIVTPQQWLVGWLNDARTMMNSLHECLVWLTKLARTSRKNVYMYVAAKSNHCYDTVFHWQAYEVIECIEAYVPVVALLIYIHSQLNALLFPPPRPAVMLRYLLPHTLLLVLTYVVHAWRSSVWWMCICHSLSMDIYYTSPPCHTRSLTTFICFCGSALVFIWHDW